MELFPTSYMHTYHSIHHPFHIINKQTTPPQLGSKLQYTQQSSVTSAQFLLQKLDQVHRFELILIPYYINTYTHTHTPTSTIHHQTTINSSTIRVQIAKHTAFINTHQQSSLSWLHQPSLCNKRSIRFNTWTSSLYYNTYIYTYHNSHHSSPIPHHHPQTLNSSTIRAHIAKHTTIIRRH